MHIFQSGDKLYPPSLYLLTGMERDSLIPAALQSHREVDDYTILIAIDGQGHLYVDEAECCIERESCWVVQPGQSYWIRSDRHVLEYFRITFRMLHLSVQDNEAAFEPFSCLGELACTPFSKLVDRVNEIYIHRDETDGQQRFYNHVRFEELLCFLLQQNDAGKRALDPRQAVERSVEFVQQHYQEQLTVDQLATEAHVPRWRYTQLFKEVTGQIPLDYINSLRMNRAKQLLLMTGDRIHEIAQNVGFTSEYYFNRRFKQTVGLAPGKYRNIHRDDLRVVSLFMEDYLVALGLTPIVQWAHTFWGKQDYLGLDGVPTYDVLKSKVHDLANQHPDVIMLRQCTGLKTDLFEECARIARTCVICQLGPDWRSTLRVLGEQLGRGERAENTIAQYEQKAQAAKRVLEKSLKGQTVAFLRVSAEMISVEKNYTAPVLYQDLGMRPHSLVMQLSTQEARAGVTWEQLSTLDADHIFYVFDKWHQAGKNAEREQIQHPLWRALPAVQNNRAYHVDFMTWMNHGVIANTKKIDEVLRVLA
ncbi:transcriptional regulator [Brevibacillus reuszeri]|uniref:Transcriptional regulator n=2 Tax=Brevibacillus reuszeri TaxID=54915 RepID=A0A0K9YJ99_9BACL|nr:transcriptional regulator [Brevibacillus reuszeri]